MLYVTTRNHLDSFTTGRILQESRDPNGGLFVPLHLPKLSAEEQKICAELVYVTWLGFQQNLKCHLDPINANFLDMDYEDFLCERRMHMLPEVSKANDILNDFWAATRTLPEEKRYLSDGLLDYICHIESAGYKLAHFWGFALADQFLGHVIPGYCMDNVTTIRYEISLWNYFGCVFDVRN